MVDKFGPTYPELFAARSDIHRTISEEETVFGRTLTKGIDRFKKSAAAATGGKLSGHDAFVLWDTFGFPVDLT